MTTAFGFHHVTAIARDAQQNVDFYAGVLGLRLVKKTVNFDDPNSYHLYFGDESGIPGSILTFFPWPRARQGRAGVGEVAMTSLAIAPRSIGYWLERFVKYSVDHSPLAIDDPLNELGTALELPPQVESSRAEIESRLDPLHEPLQPPLAGEIDRAVLA